MSDKYSILFIGNIQSEKIRLWAKYLVSLGHKLEFLSTTPGEISNVSTHHFSKAESEQGSSNGIIGSVKKFWTGWDVINKHKFDIVHVHSPFNRNLCWHASKHPACIASIWEDIDLSPDPDQEETSLSGWLNNFLSNVSLITLAHRGLEPKILPELRHHQSLEIIPTGTDIERYGNLPRIGAEKGFVRFCYVGGLVESNGPDIAIKAFDRIADARPNTLMTMVGTGDEDYTNYLKKLVRQVGLYQRVHFTDRVTDAEFDAVLKRSDVFLFPFRKNGFGIKLLGAMAAGLPIITSQEEGVSDLVIDNVTGITVPKNDEAAFATAMNRMAPDEGYRQRLGKNAKDLATKLYNFELHAERMLFLYKQIVEKGKKEKFSVDEDRKKTNPKR